MGIALDVYHLVRLEGPGCAHHLLVQVVRPEYPNWSQSAEDAADAEQRRKLEQVIPLAAATLCPDAHGVVVEGEFQGLPLGDMFYESTSRCWVDLWVAETRFGHPWIVLGVVPTEANFWSGVAEDPDIAFLEPHQPARRVRAYFVQERDFPG